MTTLASTPVIVTGARMRGHGVQRVVHTAAAGAFLARELLEGSPRSA